MSATVTSHATVSTVPRTRAARRAPAPLSRARQERDVGRARLEPLPPRDEAESLAHPLERLMDSPRLLRLLGGTVPRLACVAFRLAGAAMRAHGA